MNGLQPAACPRCDHPPRDGGGSAARPPARRAVVALVAFGAISAIVSATTPATALAAAEAGTSAAPPQAMSLGQALSYARDHQPLIRSALARLKVRQSQAGIPRAAWLPQVGATAQLIYGTVNNTSASYVAVPEVDLPRIGGTPVTSGVNLSASPSTLVAVSVGQELFDFGRIAAQTAAADALTEEARAQSEAVRLDVQLGVEEAFDAVLSAHEVLAAADDAVRRATAHRDLAQAGVKSGLRPPVELTRAKADLAQAEVLRIRATAGLETARGTLAAAIGSDAVEVDAAPNATETPPAPVAGLAEALQRAEHDNPLLQATLAHIRAAHATTRAIGRELLPNLSLTAGVSGRAGGAVPSGGDLPYGGGWIPDVPNWHAGVVLQWNIFDGVVLARRNAARAKEEQARADHDTARQVVATAVQRAWIDLGSAQQALPGLGDAVQAASANQAQADARFRAGLGTAVELADAEALLTHAEVELAVGRFGVDRARAQLGRAIGAALEPTPASR